MGRIYAVGAKRIDVDDTAAIRRLNDEEIKNLLAQALRSTPDKADAGPHLTPRQPEDGTGIILPGTPAPRH